MEGDVEEGELGCGSRIAVASIRSAGPRRLPVVDAGA